MPTLTGTSVAGKQIIYTITSAPTFVYIALTPPAPVTNRRQGYAEIELQRVASEPHLTLAGVSLWENGAILRPGQYPGTAVNNRLVINWLYAGIGWSVTY